MASATNQIQQPNARFHTPSNESQNTVTTIMQTLATLGAKQIAQRRTYNDSIQTLNNRIFNSHSPLTQQQQTAFIAPTNECNINYNTAVQEESNVLAQIISKVQELESIINSKNRTLENLKQLAANIEEQESQARAYLQLQLQQVPVQPLRDPVPAPTEAQVAQQRQQQQMPAQPLRPPAHFLTQAQVQQRQQQQMQAQPLRRPAHPLTQAQVQQRQQHRAVVPAPSSHHEDEKQHEIPLIRTNSSRQQHVHVGRGHTQPANTAQNRAAPTSRSHTQHASVGQGHQPPSEQ